MHPLWPVKLVQLIPQSWYNVNVFSATVDQTCREVKDWLHTLHLTCWLSNDQAVTVIHSGYYETVDELYCRRSWYRSPYCTHSSHLEIARAHQSIDVGCHVHRGIEEGADVPYLRGRYNIPIIEIEINVVDVTKSTSRSAPMNQLNHLIIKSIESFNL